MSYGFIFSSVSFEALVFISCFETISLCYIQTLADGETGKLGVHVPTHVVVIGCSGQGSVTTLYPHQEDSLASVRRADHFK